MRTAFRKVIIISLVGIAFLIAMCVGWYYLASQNGRTLQADGYILDADSSADTIDAEYFSSGTSYSGVGLGTIRFQNTDGESVSVEEESFLHYTDGSVSAFADGIVLDLDDYDGGVVTYYSFPAQTVLAKTGTTYETDNNGYTLEFANFLYKLSDELYLIASESLTLTCPDGSTESFSDYAELTYLEEGIVCLQSADNLWTGVTTGAYLTLANGISIDLETLEILRTSGTASLLLTDISVSDGEAVEVTASDEWIPPTFNIETTDGEDGEDAADGESGSGGNGGTGGTAGADGTDGSTGQTGLTGATKDTESVGSSEVSPTMYLTSLDVTAGSVSFQIGLDEGTWELGVGTVQIINVATGAVVYSETVDFSNQDPYYPNITGTYDCSLLSPDTEYRILVSAEYSYESGATEVTGTKSFIDRTFYTDSTGVYLDSVEVTEDTVTANLEVKSWGLTADWQNIYMDILDADGTVVGTVSWSMTDITASGSGWSEDENGNYTLSYTWFYDASDEASSTLTKDSALLSDATYTVRLYTTTAKEVQDPDEMDLKDSEEVRTLKEMPVISAVHLDEYAGYFALSVDLTDEDGNAYDTSGVTSVTYTLSDSAGNTVWSETVYTTGAYNVSLEDAGLEVGVLYTLTAAVTVYDNEKTVTIEDPTVVDTGSISYVGAAVFTFTESEPGITFNSITGNVRVEVGENNLSFGSGYTTYYVISTADGSESIYDDDTGTYVSSKTVTLDSANQSLSIPGGYTVLTDGQYFYFLLNEDDLKMKTTYLISLYAYAAVDNSDESKGYEEMLVGTIALETKSPSWPYLTLTDVGSSGDGSDHAFSVELAFPNLDTLAGGKTYNFTETDDLEYLAVSVEAEDEYEYAISQINTMQINLYAGANTATGTLVTTIYLTVSDINFYQALYQQGDVYTLTEESFGLTASALTSSNYYIEIAGIWDAGGGTSGDNTSATGNQMDGMRVVEDTKDETVNGVTTTVTYHYLTAELGIAVRTNAVLPALPAAEGGVTATPIYNSEAGDYGLQTDDSLADDTIVGYQLQANYDDNTCENLEYVTYYVFQSEDVEDYYDQYSSSSTYGDAVQELEVGGETVFKFTIPVNRQNGWTTIPSLIVYFGDVTVANSTLLTDGVNMLYNSGTYDTNSEASKTVYNYGTSGGSSSILTIFSILTDQDTSVSFQDEYQYKTGSTYLTAFYKNVCADGDGNLRFYYMNTGSNTTAKVVTCSDALSRGNHYTFAYTAVANLSSTSEDNLKYYPYDSAYYSAGDRTSFLSSPVISVWKQSAEVTGNLVMTGATASAATGSISLSALSEALSYSDTNNYWIGNTGYTGASSLNGKTNLIAWAYTVADVDGTLGMTSDSENVSVGTSSTGSFLGYSYSDNGGDSYSGTMYFNGASGDTTTLLVNLQEELFSDEDGYTHTENWYDGETTLSGNPDLIPLVANGSATSAAVLTNEISTPGSITWKVENSATSGSTLKTSTNILTFSASSSTTNLTEDQLSFLRQRLMYLVVTASYTTGTGQNQKTTTASFTSGTETLSYDSSTGTVSFTWDMTNLPDIANGCEITFSFEYYYDTGVSTISNAVLTQDVSETTVGNVTVGSSSVSAPYVLKQTTVNTADSSSYTYRDLTGNTTLTNPLGNLPFADVTDAAVSDDTLTVSGTSYTASTTTSASDGSSVVSWTTGSVSQDFTAASYGYTLGSGSTSYVYSRASSWTDTQIAVFTVTGLHPAIGTDSTANVEGIDTVTWYLSTNTQQLMNGYLYLTVYSNAKGYDANVALVSDIATHYTAGTTQEINGTTYIVLPVDDTTTSFTVTLTGLTQNTTYKLAAFYDADGTYSLQPVYDSGETASDVVVDKSDENFWLTTVDGVTLELTAATYTPVSYSEKTVDVIWNTNVQSGYEMIWTLEVWTDSNGDGVEDDNEWTTYMTYQTMLNSGIVKYPESSVYNTNNSYTTTFTFDTSDPDLALPAGTYRLVANAVASGAVTYDGSTYTVNDQANNLDASGNTANVTASFTVSDTAAYNSVVLVSSTVNSTLSGDDTSPVLRAVFNVQDSMKQLVGDTYRVYITQEYTDTSAVTKYMTFYDDGSGTVTLVYVDNLGDIPDGNSVVVDNNDIKYTWGSTWSGNAEISTDDGSQTLYLYGMPTDEVTYTVSLYAYVDADVDSVVDETDGTNPVMTLLKEASTMLYQNTVVIGDVYASASQTGGVYTVTLEFSDCVNLSQDCVESMLITAMEKGGTWVTYINDAAASLPSTASSGTSATLTFTLDSAAASGQTVNISWNLVTAGTYSLSSESVRSVNIRLR